MTKPNLTEAEREEWRTVAQMDADSGCTADLGLHPERVLDLLDRLATAEAERDEASMERGDLLAELSALRQQVADLTAERDEYVHLRDEWARACAAERRALAAQAEVIAQVRALHQRLDSPRHGCCAEPRVCNGHPPVCKASEHGLNRPTWPCPTIAALDVPAPQPDEWPAAPGPATCCHVPGGKGIDPDHCHRCWVETRRTPPTTDAEEARTDD